MRKLAFWPDSNSLSYIENPADTIDTKSVAANVAKTFVKPADARFVRLSCGQLFYYNPNAAATIAAGDVSTTGSVSVPATVQPFFCVDNVTNISVIAPTTAVISAEWWS